MKIEMLGVVIFFVTSVTLMIVETVRVLLEDRRERRNKTKQEQKKGNEENGR